MKRLIAFDFDGTLIDTKSVYQVTIEKYCTANGLPLLCFESFCNNYGEYHTTLKGWTHLPHEEQRRHLRAFCRWTEQSHSNELNLIPALLPKVKETLHTLQDAGHDLVIVTSRPSYSLDELLNHYQLQDLFSANRSHCDLEGRGHRPKPHPDKLLCVMEETGHAPDTTVMVGDTVWDIDMAHAAGTTSVAVPWGYHTLKRLGTSNPHFTVTSCLSEMSEYLTYRH